MPEPVVIGRDVWKVYGQGETAVSALQGISIEILRGEMLAVMGPSGCGKTTFLNCFSGLDEISRGKITLEGVDLHSMSDRTKSEYRARRVGFVFQSYNLLPGPLGHGERRDAPSDRGKARTRGERTGPRDAGGARPWR